METMLRKAVTNEEEKRRVTGRTARRRSRSMATG